MRKGLLATLVFLLGVGMTLGANVTFNVNMNFQIQLGNFNPATDSVDVAGSFNGWAGGDILTDADNDGIYTATLTIDPGTIEYKFRINGSWDTAENSISNRTADITGDTVLDTVWFDDQAPAPTTNVEVLLQVDMTVQLLNGNFDPSAGDIVVVRGAADQYGNWGGSVQMTEDPTQTNVYINIAQFDNVPIGSGVEYKFVILKGGDVNNPVWESTPNRSWTATGDETDSDNNGYAEIVQPVVYFSDITPDMIITQDVTVTFNVDISSAYNALMAGDTLIDTQTGTDDITSWDEVNGVCINGILSQWWDWGNDLTCTGQWAMTQTDNDGFLYSYTYTYTAGQAKEQEYKYGINSLDNEAGFGENRTFTINDSASTMVLPTDCFGSQNTDPSLPFPVDCGAMPTVIAISDIQGMDTTDAGTGNDCYPSPYEGQTVTTTGVVTAAGGSKVFIQDAPGMWNGLYVYFPGNSLTRGDSIEITGTVSEYYGVTELYNIDSVTVISQGAAEPSPIVVSTGELAGGCSGQGEQYEGVLVTLENVTVVDTVDQYGQWYVDDGTGPCQIDDVFFSVTPSLGETFTSITGVVGYSYGEYELLPRDSADLVRAPQVTFNVNMSFQAELGNFDPNADFVDVAGTFNGWAGGDTLSDPDSDLIYSVTLPIEPGTIEYKFRINGDWNTAENSISNRTADISGDTVLDTVWFDDVEPAPLENVEVLLQVDMTVQLLSGNFDPSAGDIVVVRGSADQYGNWGGSVQMTEDPTQANVYINISQFDNVPIGSGVEYKFVILKGGDVNNPIWESTPNRSWVATGDETDSDGNGYAEITQPVVYFSDITPDDIITQDVTVTWNVDISSVYFALENGDTLIDTQTGTDDITSWDEVNGVCINGILSQWWDWGNDLECTGQWAMTQTDEFGVKYTFSYTYTAGQAKNQEYKYGINSLDNEAGFAQNHTFVINDSLPTYTLPEDCFGSQNTDPNLPFPVDCGPVAVDQDVATAPTDFELAQNYPNPFNPVTTIRFGLPHTSAVSLVIYNALGEEVKSFHPGTLPAGRYELTWDGTNDLGQAVPSGLYLYVLRTDGVNLTRKMLLLK